MASIDFSKVKSEIESRKKIDLERGEQSGRLPKNALIHGLKQARSTGNPNQATQTIRAVAMVSEGKKVVGDGFGGVAIDKTNSSLNLPPLPQPKPRNDINEITQFPQQQTPNYSNNMGMMPERDVMMNSEIERRRNEYASQGVKVDNWGLPVGTPQQQAYQNWGGIMPNNSGINAESLQKLVFELMDKYLEDKMVPLMKEVLKTAIVDQYTNNVVKNSITQNEEVIKEVLKKIIKENSSKK